jgi:hypothetical protein
MYETGSSYEFWAAPAALTQQVAWHMFLFFKWKTVLA